MLMTRMPSLAPPPVLMTLSGSGPIPEAMLLCEGDCNPGWRAVKREMVKDPKLVQTQQHTLHKHLSHHVYRCTVCGSMRQWGA